jgi:hypothetical protein
MARYSDDENIHQAMLGMVCMLDPDGPYSCPWSPPRVKIGTMSIAGMIERIRFQYGDDAARSIRISVH